MPLGAMWHDDGNFTWDIYIYIYIYMKGCEIVLGFFFEQVWEFFLISWLVQFA
jgi:hypothetical protein